jgi:hypothetical protein
MFFEFTFELMISCDNSFWYQCFVGWQHNSWLFFWGSLICRYRLSFACNDKLQLGALISTFTDTRTAMVAAAS